MDNEYPESDSNDNEAEVLCNGDVFTSIAEENFNPAKEFDDCPVHQAVVDDNETKVENLIETGIDINQKDKFDCTALHYAVLVKSDAMVKLLLENGADIDAQEFATHTPLHMATNRGHETIVRLLVDHGADINICDDSENAPIHYAVHRGFKAIVEFLADMGADLMLRNDASKTPYNIATENGNAEIAELLVSKGADAKPHDCLRGSSAKEAEKRNIRMSHWNAISAYSRAINNFDPSHVEPFIGARFNYYFEWNLEHVILFSKDEFMHYIDHRFSTFKLQGRKIWAEMAEETNYPAEPCILLAANNINVVYGLVVGVMDDDGKLKSLRTVQIPLREWSKNAHIGWTDCMVHPQRDYNVKRTGKYPR